MFERFTSQARHVIVVAQEEARGLGHNYIGTEHLLLGLLAEPGGLAGQVLDSFGMSLAATRDEVAADVGTGTGPLTKGRIPFTTRAKKVLELSLREALTLHHSEIGTEHVLLGMVREGHGVGAKILTAHADNLLAIRMAVLDLVTAGPAKPGRRLLRLRRGAAATGPAGEHGDEGLPGQEAQVPRATPAADASLDEATRLAGNGPIGSHHLLLATLTDPDTAAARTLSALGVDLDQAREALRRADVAGTSDEQPSERGGRQMMIHVTGDRLTIEATDPAILRLAQAALAALGDDAPAELGTLSGDLPATASLGNVWQAVRDSLEEIRLRAVAAGAPAPDTAGRRETET